MLNGAEGLGPSDFNNAEPYTLADRTGEFTKTFTADAAARYVVVVQRVGNAPLPKGASIRVNDVEIVNDAILRREPIARRALTLAATN
ncbi:MAG TPA: hypothetical protein VM733_09495, partial [Thermoanaerobaculia bacterium]|nr:hypothetical protein [Thermoanaerobaculia bacterium]